MGDTVAVGGQHLTPGGFDLLLLGGQLRKDDGSVLTDDGGDGEGDMGQSLDVDGGAIGIVVGLGQLLQGDSPLLTAGAGQNHGLLFGGRVVGVLQEVVDLDTGLGDGCEDDVLTLLILLLHNVAFPQHWERGSTSGLPLTNERPFFKKNF